MSQTQTGGQAQTVSRPHAAVQPQWRELFAPHILQRGENYFYDGSVDGLEAEENPDGTVTLSAMVAGTRDYDVEITLEYGLPVDMYCSCPYAAENLCKHMAAVLFEAESQGTKAGSAAGSDSCQNADAEDILNKAAVIPESRATNKSDNSPTSIPGLLSQLTCFTIYPETGRDLRQNRRTRQRERRTVL